MLSFDVQGARAVDEVVGIVSAPSRRDKQKHLGPSEIGEVCDRCLSDRIRGAYKDEREGAPLAPLIGTAFHALAEQRLKESPAGRSGLLQVEKRVKVADVEGYGEIIGTVDVFDTATGDVMDWKVLSKARIAALSRCIHARLDGTVLLDRASRTWETAWKYYVQMMLYCYGLSRDGYEVRRANLLMLPRDATTDVLPGSLRTITFPYREGAARAALARFSEILDRIHGGDEPESFESSDGCYTCGRRKREERNNLAMLELWGPRPAG